MSRSSATPPTESEEEFWGQSFAFLHPPEERTALAAASLVARIDVAPEAAGALPLLATVADLTEHQLRKTEKEAEKRRAFLNHPLKRIHEWATNEVDRAKHSAEVWRERKKKRPRARK